MKIENRSRTQAFVALLAGVVLLLLLTPARASAALGGDVTSVQADRQQMKATRSTAVQAVDSKYTVHEITTPYGTMVREYVSPDGKVFGVAWRGPFLPNFQQLLGDSYASLSRARSRPEAGRSGTRAMRR